MSCGKIVSFSVWFAFSICSLNHAVQLRKSLLPRDLKIVAQIAVSTMIRQEAERERIKAQETTARLLNELENVLKASYLPPYLKQTECKRLISKIITSVW